MKTKRIDFTLFKPDEPESLSGAAVTNGAQVYASSSSTIATIVAAVKEKKEVYWVTQGEWSMHQLLLALLQISGAAKVFISSYAMGETPARILAQLKEEGTITHLACVLDNRVEVRSAGSLQLMRAISNEFALVANHAKVTIIQNVDWQITVVGSANYTENKRFECGVISCQKAAFDLNIQWIQTTIALCSHQMN